MYSYNDIRSIFSGASTSIFPELFGTVWYVSTGLLHIMHTRVDYILHAMWL